MCKNANEYHSLEQTERGLLERMEDQRKKGNHALLAKACSELGILYRNTGRYEDSLQSFQEAGEEILRVTKAESVEYALLLNNMAGTFRLMGRREQAVEIFRQAVDICRWQSAGGTLVCILSNLSLVCQEMGHNDEAIQYLEEALELLRRSDSRPCEMAVICHNLTILYYRLGCREEADRYLELALKSLDVCDYTNGDVHCIEALCSIAGLLYSMGEYRRSADVYQKAAEYSQRWFGENEEYASICQSMSWAYEALKEWEPARRALTTAARVFSQNLGEKHARTKTAQDMLRRLRGLAS